MKKIAIQLYGHMRTYKYTYENFFKYIIFPNINDGYAVDIFIHTWEQFNRYKSCWYDHNLAFPTLNNKLLTENDIDEIKDIYKPVCFLLEELGENVNGQSISLDRVANLRLEYENYNKIKYDYIFTTRPDILFYRKIRIKHYLDLYENEVELKGTLPNKFLFSSTILFRLGVIDGRYANEGDLVFFSNFDARWSDIFRGNIPRIFMCAYGDDFIMLRENMLNEEYLIPPKQRQIKILEDYFLKENKMCNRNLLSFQTKHGTAKSRIQNQLSYKLGQTLIINSKSIFGILCMPIYIISTIINHNQEQKIYKAKIKKDPSLKLPPLESYPDYKEAIKLKNHLSYKLGQALIKANKTWYKGGYVKLWFEIGRLKREFKKKINFI
ncbi:galactosyltransferase [Campylobacter volucris]|uniref:Galactosyltransferase n=1 Tax=Campylobacter volucris TaxID=1031542 RepID=A0A5C7E147_9BACT|nr:galactosyltransferase [Campylobacter volucris]TXE88340.1 galactosyltransferase [Campylobacter volucris]